MTIQTNATLRFHRIGGLPNELASDRFDGTPACPTRQRAVVFDGHRLPSHRMVNGLT